MAELREQAKALEEEVISLRRRLQDAPEAGAHARGAPARDQGPARPGRLAEREADLHAARGARAHRRAARGGRQAHPAAVGLRHVRSARTTTAPSTCSPAAARCGSSLHPELDDDELERGAEVVLNESLQRRPGPRAASSRARSSRSRSCSTTATRALIVGRADEERVCELADALHRRAAARRATRCSWTRGRACCSRSCPGPRSRSSCSKRCPTSPTTTSAASTARSSRSPTRSSCRSCTRSCSPSTGCRRPKGILLYGPPGCGKTLIAKAVANSLAKKVAEVTGDKEARSYFLNIKGPELLNKYVGETERQIRLVFQRAREKSEEGWPVIVFFDEMDSMFRTRGSGISSDMESTIVPAAAGRDRRRRGAEERDRDRRLQPRGPDRPGHPAPGPPRREDQDRAARRARPPRRSSRRYLTADLPLDADEVRDARRRRRRRRPCRR